MDTASQHDGVVKFYSDERGYGFIASTQADDVYFHITDILGPRPPKTGEQVTFSLEIDHRRNKPRAKRVAITSQALSAKRCSPATLDGFPCISGDGIKDFEVERSFGRLVARRKNLRGSLPSTVNETKEDLIQMARGVGANAIFSFYWHKERDWLPGFFGGRRIVYYWSEGVAVRLRPLR